MSDFDVTFSNDTFDISLDDRTFDVTFDNDDFRVDFAIEGVDGEQGPQGAYYVKLFRRSTDLPPTPTDVTWTPGQDRGTLSGANSYGWTLFVPDGVNVQAWEVEGFYNPANGDTNITTWSAVYRAGAEGPAGPAGPAGTTPSISVAATDRDPGSGATVTRSGTDASPTFTFGIPNSINTVANPVGTNTGHALTRIQIGSTIYEVEGTHALPAEHVSITLSPSHIEQNTTGDTTVTGVITVNAPYQYVTTQQYTESGGTGTDSLRAHFRQAGGNNFAPLTHSPLSSPNFSFVVTELAKQTVQDIDVSALVRSGNAYSGGFIYTQGVSATFSIVAPIPHWYVAYSTSAPSSLTDMVDQGNFTGTDEYTFTATDTGSRDSYILLPTRSGGYTFTSDVYVLDSRTVGQTFQSGYTMYNLPDVDDAAGASGTYIVTIREA